jgi:hypothetical protein
MPFAAPKVWKEQTDYHTDYYLCLAKIDGHNSKSKHTIIYSNTPDGSPGIPKPLQQWALHEEATNSTSPEDEPGHSGSYVDPDFSELTVPHLISQSELKDLARDLSLSKIQRNFASRLQ